MAADRFFNDLDDDLVQLVINQLPALFQVAATRGCSRFKKLALKTTNLLDVYYIPYDKRIEIVDMMPKLESVCGLKCGSWTWDEDGEDDQFLKNLGMANPNITSIKGRLHTYLRRAFDTLDTSYVKSVKLHNQSYTGFDLKYVFQEYEVYEQLFIQYPDLQLKYSLNLYSFDIESQRRGSYLHVAQLTLDSKPAEITPILNKTINVTDLTLTIRPGSDTFRLNYVLESISRLPLRVLFLSWLGICIKANHHQWKSSYLAMVPDDYKSLQNVFNIPSLRTVDLRLDAGNVDRRAIYDSFLNSSNNCFRSIRCVIMGKARLSYNCRFRNEYQTWLNQYVQVVNIDSVPNFDISTFVNKFKKNCNRHFEIVCTDGRNFDHYDYENLPFTIEFQTTG